ncbi:HNH endonuclease signature motif containing protein [[Mycoplasma] gypis]|uniref:HNH endonuclease signature motif containing protein n=1 Tax=[Mycoplasma] gypis TaxID=92404 RepID=A0ABZ2RPX7_9BACT|nr:HNH endonuclease signature motif containing protein [[Mycoplasma] gypis]MBN0919147.1 HNH endonuclease [[Mycoplasma] gypis]
MNIVISQSLINALQKETKNRNWNYTKDDILKMIFLRLNEDKILLNEKYENILWKISNEKFQGICLGQSVVYFTQAMDFKTNTPKSRNTFFEQNFVSLYIKLKDKYKYFFVSLNPLDTAFENIKFAKTIILYILISSKVLGLNINKSINDILHSKLNQNSLQESNNQISNFHLFQNTKIKNILKNKNNSPSYITVNSYNKTIYFYSKIDGANFARTYLDILITNLLWDTLNKENYEKIIILNTENKKLINKLTDLLKTYDFEILLNGHWKNADFDNINYTKERKTLRNQALFLKNIIEKYGVKNCLSCFACDYPNYNNLIKSHIHRVADIESEINQNINVILNTEIINSGNNGFLLCPNHDREFENGSIFFDLKEMNFKVSKMFYEKNKDIATYIQKTLKNKSFLKNKEKNFVYCVQKHTIRTKNNI